MTDEVDGHKAPRGNRRKPKSRAYRIAKIAGIVLSVLVLIVAGLGTWLYNKFSGNLHTVSIGGSMGAEKADPYGRTPIDFLVIGTDARNNAQDCQLGGDCGSSGYGNADVEMVVHISADRSNATVMSIPRDTMVNVPACTDPNDPKNTTTGYYGMINSALSYGPQCQMQTIHDLTNIPLQHFMMIDFSGVVNMSDAVGGVNVCVDNNVYDTYSHLKLAKGTHTLKGVSALEFLRSRHGFGDGSDLGRTYAQHMYLSALMRQVKSAGTLTSPTALYSLADSATKALTVDNGIGSVGSLLNLAAEAAKVPTSHITFTTMQTMPDPSNQNRLVPAPGAQSLFGAIVNDQSLSGGKSGSSDASSTSASAAPTPSASASPTTASFPAAQIDVQVENGSGVNGRGSDLANYLTGKGYGSGTTAVTAPQNVSTTELHYGNYSTDKAEAETVAASLGIPASHISSDPSMQGVVLIVGTDWTSGDTYPGGTAKPAPVDTKTALQDSHSQTANDGNVCAPVSTQQTVELNGVPMSPIQAYAAAANVPNSAP
ncbi:LCP family protein [Streptacidiphilus fuscans]|uniref:LCP family protein n=1 Tax=Streptacidiphilus fuscans TaxID=2789292 RepID=A0A931B2T6_9ACTN|nr:LCP family protein [Streptacidiphilus fuscans]MBF9068242.1 LCP family protein [Streptacidiphilus fuscans]